MAYLAAGLVVDDAVVALTDDQFLDLRPCSRCLSM